MDPSDPLRVTVERALGSQYDVLRSLGRGGMGAVYLARERLLERLVAVKVLPHEAATADGGRERFLREARTAAQLSHPNIVPLYSFAEAEGTFLYIMGFVDGESLETLLARESRLPAAQTRRVLGEIADALDYAHRQGVVHRDVKPDNILIEAGTGRAVLTDFGVAKHGTDRHTLTRTGMVVGTPHYMSPEQATADRALDGRSDLYALGIIGYRMLSGRLPFEAASLPELLMQHVTRDPPPLRSDDAEEGAATRAVMRCLQKDPAQRFQTGAALSRALNPTEEIGLPDELVHVPSAAIAFGAAVAGLDFGVALLYVYDPDPKLLKFAMLSPLALVFVGLGIVGAARKHGLGWRSILRMIFWAPSKWWGWWPSPFRRPGDVWAGLPKDVRLARSILTGSLGFLIAVLVPGMLLMIAWAIKSPLPVGGGLGELLMFLSFAVSASFVAGLALTVPWAKRYDLSYRMATQLIFEPTWGNAKFWKRPELAKVWGAGTNAIVSGPRTAPELVSAISEVIDALPVALQGVGRDVGAVARDLLRIVGAIDGEIRELSRDADPAERARLEQKLMSIGRAAVEESQARRQMRDLLSGQVRLHDELEARLRNLGDERERQLALLRSLWLEIASLRARFARELVSDAELTQRVRGLCDEIVRQRSAVSEVARSLRTGGPT